MQRLVFSLATVLAITCAASAQQPSGMTDHGAMDQHGSADTPAARAYMDAMRTMQRSMHAPLTGDADIDFLRGMIAHHQGAIDMANVELRYGSDPKLRDLAQKIIAAQTVEIAQMRTWLSERGNAGSGK